MWKIDVNHYEIEILTQNCEAIERTPHLESMNSSEKLASNPTTQISFPLFSWQTIILLQTQVSSLTDIVFQEMASCSIHRSQLKRNNSISCYGCWECVTWNPCSKYPDWRHVYAWWVCWTWCDVTGQLLCIYIYHRPIHSMSMHHANAHANNQLREITYVAKQRNTHQNL